MTSEARHGQPHEPTRPTAPIAQDPATRPWTTGRLALVALAASIAWGLPACGVRIDESGIRAAMLYELLAPSEAVTTEMGDLVVIADAQLSVRSVELLRCDEADAGETTASLLAPLGRWLSSRASAHTEDSPTRLGTPVMLGLEGVGDDGPASPGILRPPPGEYCALRVLLGAPDEAPGGDAARITGRYLSHETMVGFARSTRLSNAVRIDMPRLVLASPSDTAEIWLRADAAHWLDSMSLSNASADDRVRLTEQVAASIRVHWTASVAR